jgi:ATP:ADP antiporter, AAA family
MIPTRSTASEPRTLLSHPEFLSQRSFPVFTTLGEARKSPLERALSVFADVRAGEGIGVILLAANVFLLLAAYYLLKTAREALILTEGGAEVKAYSSAAQAVLLIGVVPAYGWLATRVKRMTLIAVTSVFFASNLVLFYVIAIAGVREGVVFYIWLGIFNVFVVSQFWAFANDIYTEGQGRRLFPIVGVGSSLGAWIGASAAVPLVERARFTPQTLMVAGAVILVISLGITWVVNQRETRRSDPQGAEASRQPLGSDGGFELILKDRYLFWIAVLTILLNVVNTSGEFLLSRLVIDAAASQFTDAQLVERQRFVAAFYGSFFGGVNLLGLLLQLFATSRLIRHIGVRGALFVLPTLALVSYSVIAVAPLLAVVRVTKTLENSTDYSVQNTIRQALYLPTTREAKYKAKAAIDTFFTRLGDVTQAGIVAGGTALRIGTPGFAWLNVALTVGWLWVAGRIVREHRKRTV